MRHGLTLRGIALLALASVLLSHAARAEDFLDDRFGIRAAPILLLMRLDVQNELGFDSDQKSEALHAGEALYRQALGLKGKAGPAIVAARRAIDEEQTQWLTTHLSSSQLDRLTQVDLQWEGVTAMLSRPMIQESLRLEPAQKTALIRLAETRRHALQQNQFWSIADQTALLKKAHGVLNDKQRAVWSRLIGPPCRFTIAPPPPPVANSAATSKVAPPTPAAGPAPLPKPVANTPAAAPVPLPKPVANTPAAAKSAPRP